MDECPPDPSNGKRVHRSDENPEHSSFEVKSPSIEEGIARLLASDQRFAWMRHRIEIERSGAERSDDAPPRLKGWKKL